MSEAPTAPRPAGVVYPELGRVDRLDAARLRALHVEPGIPVVVRVGEPWARRWTPELLRSRFGSRAVPVQREAFHPKDRADEEVALDELVDGVLSGSKTYRLLASDFLALLPELREEFEASPYFEGILLDARLAHNLWLAPAGNLSSFHHDANLDNLNLQVSGRKRFILAPPSAFAAVEGDGSLAFSPLDPFAVGSDVHARLLRAGVVEATLEPGEMLFLPQLWWHCVRAEEVSLNINTWSARSPSSTWRSSKGAPLRVRALLSLYAAGQPRPPTAAYSPLVRRAFELIQRARG